MTRFQINTRRSNRYIACAQIAALLCASGRALSQTQAAPPDTQIYTAVPAHRSQSISLPGPSNNVALLPGHERPPRTLKPYVAGHPTVLMAISGGGSRSAYYAARVMEELSRIPVPGIPGAQETYMSPNVPAWSMVDTVRAISTISAGGMAASYLVINYSARKSPTFYEDFKAAMAVNLQWRTYGHMAIFPPAALQLLASSVTRTDLLAEEIDKVLGDKKTTFDDLLARELAPVDPAPALVINGTVYNSGQRLVMSNLPAALFPSLSEASEIQVAMPAVDRQILFNLMQPLTMADMGSDIGQFSLGKAIAASAAYPILLAPVPLNIFPQNIPALNVGRADAKLLQSEVAYVADGGLYENEGLDSLVSILKSMPRSEPVLVVVIDASQRMETLSLPQGQVWGPVQSMGRMYDIGTLKPLAFYNSLISEFHDTDKLEMVFIRMESNDPAVQQKLRDIPTTFKLDDEHRGILDQVAQSNTAAMRDHLLNAYVRLTERPAKVKPTAKKSKAKQGRPTSGN